MSANPELVAALAPLVSRMRTDTCWRKGPDGPRRIEEPLTAAKLAQHTNGGPAYGAAPIKPGSDVTWVGLLDLDSHKGATPWPEMLAATGALMHAMVQRGLAPIAFKSSGGRGVHVYALWDDPQDAYSVRMLLTEVLAGLGLADGAKGLSNQEVEVFPKQDSVRADGFGNMFILPLAGASVPLCPFTLDDLAKEDAIGMDWPVSNPVPVRVKPEVERRTLTAAEGADLARVASALDAIPNDGEQVGYEEWRDLIFGLHHASNGSAAGLELAHAFSARSPKYDPAFLDSRVWPYVKTDVDGAQGAITAGTIFKAARAAGWVEPIADDFEALPALVDEKGDAVRDAPKFRRNAKGAIVACIENVAAALREPTVAGVAIRFDEFRAEIMLAAGGMQDWRSFADADYTRLQIHLERNGFDKLAKEMVRDAVWLVADDNRFDSAIEWIGTLVADGGARIETFLHRYLGVVDTPYTRAVSRYMWTAMAGRVLRPGCEAPMVPVFVGAQGAGKTRAVKALAPAADFYTELNLAERDAEASRRMRGRLVIELGELRGLHTKDAESIKAFISRTDEEWRVLYKEFNTTFARRFLFFGTTNQEEFLADETGERRWLPVRVGECDVAALQRDVLLLWAEARDVFTASGVDWAEAERLARGVHGEHKVSDPWFPLVQAWLANPQDLDESGSAPGTREFLQVIDVLQGAVRMDPKQVGKREEMRMGKILQVLGYERGRVSSGGRQVKAWVKGGETT